MTPSPTPSNPKGSRTKPEAPLGRESPAIQALLDRIERIKDFHTYRGKVTIAGHEMVGVVERDIAAVRVAEKTAQAPIPAPAAVAALAAALRDTSRLGGETEEQAQRRRLETRQRAATLIEDMAIKLAAAGLL